MSKSRKVGVVDSYAAIKAVQRAGEARPATPVAPSSEPGADLKALGAHVAHTAIPAKRVIECHECGYKFQIHGRAPTTTCNKCRAILDLTDHTIDKRWSGLLKTAGTVHIASSGVVESGNIIANDIILEGTIEAGIVRAIHRLELRPGARFSEQNINAPDLLIATGATMAFIDPAEYRDVEIAGTFRANLHTTGRVTIRATGSFEGNLQTTHLIVEEGGGLNAKLQVEAAPEAPETKRSVR